MREQNIEKREKICRKCPIFNPVNQTCNPKLYLNPDTDEISTSPKQGFVRGCGCLILKKLRIQSSKCIAGKW